MTEDVDTPRCEPPAAHVLDVRSALALLAVAALGWTLSGCGHGAYSLQSLLGALLALGAALAACAYRTARPFRLPRWAGTVAVLCSGVLLASLFLLGHPAIPKASRLGLALGALAVAGGLASGRVRPKSAAVGLMAAIALLLAGIAVLWCWVLYPDVRAGVYLIHAASSLGFLLIAASLVLDLGAPGGVGPAFRARLGLLFLSGAVLRVGAIVATPDPIIDVYSWLDNAPRHILRGENPYAVEYPDPYVTPRGVQCGYATEADAAAAPKQKAYAGYPPLPVVLMLPCAALGVDVRYANVACDLVAAAALFLVARRRGAPLIGALACGIYLHLPSVPLVMQNAWFEPMLAAALGLGLYLVDRGDRLGYFLVGLGLAGKQFGLAMLPAAGATHRKQARRLAVWGGLAAVLLPLPFFLWGPREFLDSVFFLQFVRATPDLNSLTLRSGAYHLLGRDIPGWVTAGVVLLLGGWVCWRGREAGSGAGLWIGAALLVFCLCLVRGYVNYYYLCEYLLLLGATALASAATAAAGARGVPVPRPTPSARAA